MKVTWENVLYRVNRRYCGSCKKQVTARVPDAMPNARTSSNHDALLTHLNVNGLSHAKTAQTSCDALKHNISASSSYRGKIRTSKMLEPDHDSIRKKIIQGPVLNCDELWWPLGKNKWGGDNRAGQGCLPDGGGRIQRHSDADGFSAAVRWCCSAGLVCGMDACQLKPPDVSGHTRFE